MTQHEVAGPRWRRYAAEIATIIVGILLALAADAGRQYLADRGTERERLAALRVEFAADVREIGGDEKARSGILAAIERLSAARVDVTRMPPPEELAAAVLRTLEYRYSTASHPVPDATEPLPPGLAACRRSSHEAPPVVRRRGRQS